MCEMNRFDPDCKQTPRAGVIGMRIDEATGAIKTCIAHTAGAGGTACRARPVKRQLRSGAGCFSRFARGACMLQ
jgi:hypothetical protein